MPEYIDPSGHFVFYEILCSSNFYNSFSFFYSKGLKVKYLRHLQIKFILLIIIFSVSILLVFKYKIYKKEIELQHPIEPREHRLGEVQRSRKVEI